MSAPPGRRSGPAHHLEPAHDDASAVNHQAYAPGPTQRRPRRRWTVVIESKHCAHVTGHGSREMLTEMRGRPPLWSSVSRAWVTTEDTARDLIARAERQGVQVDVESYVVLKTVEPTRSSGPDHLVEQPDPGRGLW